MPSTERQILVAPDMAARLAARLAGEPEQRWLLGQPREVRRSFAEEVFERPDEDARRQVWMLRQRKAVRDSFIAEVLAAQRPTPHEEIWMLRQTDKVRESYVRDVLLRD